jgi:hypothetical protein
MDSNILPLPQATVLLALSLLVSTPRVFHPSILLPHLFCISFPTFELLLPHGPDTRTFPGREHQQYGDPHLDAPASLQQHIPTSQASKTPPAYCISKALLFSCIVLSGCDDLHEPVKKTYLRAVITSTSLSTRHTSQIQGVLNCSWTP